MPDYDEWLRLVFDHPAREEELSHNNWIWDDDVETEVSDSDILISHMTRLCNDFVTSTSGYSLPQIDGGIWTLLSEPVRLADHLAYEAVPLKARLDCIHSMLRPYADFVAPSQVEVMENCFDMWWDLVAGDYWRRVNLKYNSDAIMARYIEYSNNATNDDETEENITEPPDIPDVTWDELNADEQAILGAMLTTLTQILALGDGRCEQYALHGLGHLQHPQRREVVQRYIDANAYDWPEDGLNWLKQCRDGTVM